MPYQRSSDLPLRVLNGPLCRHLRSKAMYVTGEFCPQHVDEEGSHYAWCNLTQHIVGPDEGDVDRACCTPNRPCYCDG